MIFNIDTSIIIAVAGGIVSVSAAYLVVKKAIQNQFNKIKDNLKKEMKEEIKVEIIEPTYAKAVEEYRKDLKEITEQLSEVTSEFKTMMNEQRKLNKSAIDFRISTLKGLIVQSHSTYTQLGHIEPLVLETIEDVYKTYTELGGNHFVKDLMEEVRKLPKE